jgi:hypothetical protein
MSSSPIKSRAYETGCRRFGVDTRVPSRIVDVA